MQPSVAVIVLNWNGKTDTLECLASLEKDFYGSKQVIVVDNGSTDDSVAAIKESFQNAMLLETGENLGFTGGNNFGISYALKHGAHYVFLLNNDTTVEPDAITKLVETAETNLDFGIFTPVIHYYDRPQETWFAGSRMDMSLGVAVHDNSRIPKKNEFIQEIPWASGCALLIRAEVIKSLSGFDDRYFLNWEDVDISLRAVSLGNKIGMVPGARILHKVSSTLIKHSRAAHYYYARNNLLLIKTHCGKKQMIATRAVITTLIWKDLRAIRKRQQGAYGRLLITLKAFHHHFTSRYGRCDTL